MKDLLTRRLALHPLTLAEAIRIAAVAPGAADRWCPGFPTDGDRDGARMYAKSVPGHAPDAEPGPFGCYRIDHSAGAIGTVGFHGPPDRAGQVTVGYGLVRRYRGHGYATEAVRAVIELCRSHPEVRAVLADTAPDNHPSQRVLAKNGFQLVGADPDLVYFELPMRPATGSVPGSATRSAE